MIVTSVALPHVAVGWSAVCDCGISRPYSLAYFLMQEKEKERVGHMPGWGFSDIVIHT